MIPAAKQNALHHMTTPAIFLHKNCRLVVKVRPLLRKRPFFSIREPFPWILHHPLGHIFCETIEDNLVVVDFTICHRYTYRNICHCEGISWPSRPCIVSFLTDHAGNAPFFEADITISAFPETAAAILAEEAKTNGQPTKSRPEAVCRIWLKSKEFRGLKMKGFFNQLIRVNLRSKTFDVEAIPQRVFEVYLGGKGLGTYLLIKNNPPRIDPLSAENRIVFAIGCTSDLKVHGSSRYGVYTKSPQTGIYSESYSGGGVAVALSRTGYDAVILEDSSPTPVFLEVSPWGVTFHDASAVWGKTTYEAEDHVLEAVGKEGAEAVVIGPAGENLVRFSVLESGYWRSAGRTGVGAVLGSKRVKAIVFHGEKRREPADPNLLEELWKAIREKGKDNPVSSAFRKLGTPMLVSIMNTVGGFPTRYWSEGCLDGWENITAESLLERCHVEPTACPHCFLACGNLCEVKEGRHRGLRVGGPEYETIYAFGGLCMINSIEEIIYLNDICDRLGMDTISAGNLAAFTIEASKRKRIDEKLDYGDVDGIARLLGKIARREGLGAVLAQGIVEASKAWGLEELAIHVKGLEPAGYEPRVLKGMGLSYATSDRGACHLRATFYKSELSGQVDPDQIRGKARIFVEDEDRMTLFDTLILCRFYKDLVDWEDLQTLIRAITGVNPDRTQLRDIAANVTNAARWFNIREGVTRADDRLPNRFYRETIGEVKKRSITEEDLNCMLDEYYESRGWDKEGVPPSLPEL